MDRLIVISVTLLLFIFINSCAENKAKTVPNNRLVKDTTEKKSFEEVKIDSEIILSSLIDSKHYYYDTCVNDIISNIFESNNSLNLNFVDLKLLKYYAKIDTSIKNDVLNQWPFLRTSSFNLILNDMLKNKKASVANNWQNIFKDRYILILKERKKILPRTNFEHYVLGGMFDGGIFLYDLHDYKTICYFNFRVNNTSNKIDFYSKYKADSVYDAMVLELTEKIKVNLGERITEKFGENAKVKIKY